MQQVGYARPLAIIQMRFALGHWGVAPPLQFQYFVLKAYKDMEAFTILVPLERRQFFLDLIDQLGFDRRLQGSDELQEKQLHEIQKRRSMYIEEDASNWEIVMARLHARG